MTFLSTYLLLWLGLLQAQPSSKCTGQYLSSFLDCVKIRSPTLMPDSVCAFKKITHLLRFPLSLCNCLNLAPNLLTSTPYSFPSKFLHSGDSPILPVTTGPSPHRHHDVLEPPDAFELTHHLIHLKLNWRTKYSFWLNSQTTSKFSW